MGCNRKLRGTRSSVLPGPAKAAYFPDSQHVWESRPGGIYDTLIQTTPNGRSFAPRANQDHVQSAAVPLNEFWFLSLHVLQVQSRTLRLPSTEPDVLIREVVGRWRQ
ncbi:hypothetical protein J6590_010078 [Homalodisca vitripennis]|nr:hypothetical protein J6590_010078 [Homalodisca vitripennis]